MIEAAAVDDVLDDEVPAEVRCLRCGHRFGDHAGMMVPMGGYPGWPEPVEWCEGAGVGDVPYCPCREFD